MQKLMHKYAANLLSGLVIQMVQRKLMQHSK